MCRQVYQSAWHNIPEHLNLYQDRREDLKSRNGRLLVTQFYIFRTVHLCIILAGDQLDAQLLL